MDTYDAITHAFDKINECADELNCGTAGTPEFNHSLFQMSYNIGRLAEITGVGRALYDDVKPHIAASDWECVAECIGDFVLAL